MVFACLRSGRPDCDTQSSHLHAAVGEERQPVEPRPPKNGAHGWIWIALLWPISMQMVCQCLLFNLLTCRLYKHSTTARGCRYVALDRQWPTSGWRNFLIKVRSAALAANLVVLPILAVSDIPLACR